MKLVWFDMEAIEKKALEREGYRISIYKNGNIVFYKDTIKHLDIQEGSYIALGYNTENKKDKALYFVLNEKEDVGFKVIRQGDQFFYIKASSALEKQQILFNTTKRYRLLPKKDKEHGVIYKMIRDKVAAATDVNKDTKYINSVKSKIKSGQPTPKVEWTEIPNTIESKITEPKQEPYAFYVHPDNR